MAFYEIKPDSLYEVPTTTFAAAGIDERKDLQRLLRDKIQIVEKDALIIAEEFQNWDGSNRRIDLLGLDKDANLVVFELKRTEDGGHMELQALRYAAMVSTMTFKNVEEVYATYLKKRGQENIDARSSILSFLKWAEPDEQPFAQDVRIVLVSAEFSKEITTSVLWLNKKDLDIRCVRLKPYSDGGRTLIEVQRIIPLPETDEYTIRIKEKLESDKVARESSKDFTKYDLMLGGTSYPRQSKRMAMFRVVKYLVDSGVTPEKIKTATGWEERRFRSVGGDIRSREAFIASQQSESDNGFDASRYFCDDESLLHSEGKTCVLSNQWGTTTLACINDLIEAFPDKAIECTASGASV